MIDSRAMVAAVFALALGSAGGIARAEPQSDAAIEPQSEPVLITLAGSNQLVISHAANATTERFPLVVIAAAKVEVGKLEASVLAVTRDGSIQATVPTAVTAMLEAPAGGVPVLAVSVDFTRLFVPGSYEVTIAISQRARAAAAGAAGSAAGGAVAPAGGAAAPAGGAGAPAGGAGAAASRAGSTAANSPAASADATASLPPQRLILRLIVPPAVLRAVPPIVVEREVPLFGAPHGTAGVVTLRETSNVSPVTLIVSQDGPLIADDRVVSGQVGLADLAPIDPGKAATATLTFSGELPVGTTRGNLLLTARELAAPIVVPVEIRSRRAGWLVPLLFLVGAALGGLWRTVLAKRRTSLAAELATNALYDRITAVIDAQPADWAADVIVLRLKRDALDPTDPACLTAAEQELDKAVDCRNGRITELAKAIHAALVATRTAWRLPLGLDLTEAAACYSTADGKLQRGAFGDAITSADRGATALASVLDRCRTWCSALARFAAPLADGVPGCPWPGHTGVDQAVTQLITALDAAEAAMTSDCAALARLQAMHAAARAATELASALAEALDQLRRTLPGPLDAALAARLQNAATLPSRPSERSDEAIQDGVAACAALAAVADDALPTLYPPTLDPNGVPPAATEALDAGKYLEALTPPRDVAIIGRGNAVSARTAPIVESIAAPLRRVTAEPLATAVVVSLDAPQAAAHRSARRLHAELDGVTMMRWAIGAIVTSAAAWVLYGEAFAGTHLECFAVFAAGFLTDLTTDTAIDAVLGRLKPPVAAGTPAGS